MASAIAARRESLRARGERAHAQKRHQRPQRVAGVGGHECREVRAEPAGTEPNATTAAALTM